MSEKKAKSKKSKKSKKAKLPEFNGKFEDITSSSKPKNFWGKVDHFFKYTFNPFFRRNHHRNLKVFVGIACCLLVLCVSVIAYFIAGKLGKINTETYAGVPDASITYGDDDDLYENISYSPIDDATGDSIKSIIYSWATNNGEKMYSKNVINVLLIGEDRDEDTHRSDSMILVSLNKVTKKISLVSFLRDSYTYMNIPGASNPERYDKINHSYAWGGPLVLLETLENNFKIQIDHYFTIDFSSFTKAIDAVGGVDVPVTEKEANYMNRTTHYDDFVAGDSVHLDGSHALIFSRIRKLDSEAARTDRQKLVIKALISKTKSASVGQLNNLLDQLLPLMSTNYSKAEIMSLGTQAITKGWMNYEIVTMTEPAEEFRVEASMTTYSYRGLFVWVVDYPMAAQSLQNALYGKSNIVIGEDHRSATSMANGYYNYNSYDDDDSSGSRRGSLFSKWEERRAERRSSVFNWGTDDGNSDSGNSYNNDYDSGNDYDSDYDSGSSYDSENDSSYDSGTDSYDSGSENDSSYDSGDTSGDYAASEEQ